MARIAMLIDTAVCTGCRGCQVACKQWWDLPGEDTKNRGSYENPGDLSPTTWTRVTFHEMEGNGRLQWYQLAWGCMHCAKAPCVDVCPTSALKYHPLGAVTLEQGLCNGCGYCSTACPFNIPRLERDVLTGKGKATKCNFCQDRITNGLIPGCVKTCPPGAIRFGVRDEMLKVGRSRVGALREKGFAEANLYGEDLLGGTGRMYVLAMSPDKYNLPVRPTYPYLVKLWQQVFQPLGPLAVVATVVGVTANWFVTWRLRGKKKEEEV